MSSMPTGNDDGPFLVIIGYPVQGFEFFGPFWDYEAGRSMIRIIAAER